MATKQGEYLVNDAIEVTYQAVGLATGKTITMSVYDEGHALDAPKSGAMTEIVATGRYYKAFTPDAEGIWTVVIINTTDSNGPMVKQYAVAGHSIDDIGDVVVGIDTVVDGIQTDLSNETDGLGALKTLIDAKATPAQVATELGTYDAPTKAELDSGLALLATPAQVATALGTYDAPTKTELDSGLALLATPAQVATALGTYDSPTKAEMDAGFAALLSPAMVG
jgi:hypothetical protein